MCVSTSWAAAREFGPRHTPAPRSTLAHGGAFGKGGRESPASLRYMLPSRHQPQIYCASRQIPNISAAIDPPDCLGGSNKNSRTRANHCSDFHQRISKYGSSGTQPRCAFHLHHKPSKHPHLPLPLYAAKPRHHCASGSPAQTSARCCRHSQVW